MYYDLNLPEIESWQLHQARVQMTVRLGLTATACAHPAVDTLTDRDRCA
jgi:hypothetical protein